MQKNNLVAVLAVFAVEFSYGLAPPFMGLLVGESQRDSQETWAQAEMARRVA